MSDSRTRSLRRCASIALAVLVGAGIVGIDARAQSTKRQVPVESVIYDLKNPDPVRRREAVEVLGNNKIQRAVPELVAAAGDSDVSVRRAVVVALDRMLDARALPAFVALMKDTDRDIRDRAIQAAVNLYLPQEGGLSVTLTRVANFFNPWSDEWAEVVIEPGLTPDPSLIAALRDRLVETDEALRIKGARALGILRGRDAIPALVEALREDRSNAVRFEAVRALRKVGDVSAARDLQSFASYTDAKVRNEAIYTLGRFRFREAIPDLERLYEKEAMLPAKQGDRAYRAALLEALAFVAEPSSKEIFLREQKSANETLRLHAYEGLARIGDASMVTEISRDHLQEKDPKVNAAQAFALFRMGRREYLDEVVSALGSRHTHNEAKQYLVELRREELPELYAQVRNKEVAVRESLAEVLGIIGDAAAVAPLQELAKDTRGQITAFANQALRRINARQQ